MQRSPPIQARGDKVVSCLPPQIRRTVPRGRETKQSNHANQLPYARQGCPEAWLKGDRREESEHPGLLAEYCRAGCSPSLSQGPLPRSPVRLAVLECLTDAACYAA